MCAVIWVCDFTTSKKVAVYVLRVSLGWSVNKVMRLIRTNHHQIAYWSAQVEDMRDDTVFEEHLAAIESALEGHSR